MKNEVNKEDIEGCYGYSMSEACTILGIEMKDLKRLCRQYNIKRWPKKTKLDLNFKKEYKHKTKHDSSEPILHVDNKMNIYQSNSQGSQKIDQESREIKSRSVGKISVKDLLSGNSDAQLNFAQFSWDNVQSSPNRKEQKKNENSRAK